MDCEFSSLERPRRRREADGRSKFAVLRRKLFKMYISEGYNSDYSETLTAVATTFKRKQNHERDISIAHAQAHIMSVYEENLASVKIKMKYPKWQQFKQLLIHYIELECEFLNESSGKFQEKQVFNVLRRMWITLMIILRDTSANEDLTDLQIYRKGYLKLLHLFSSLKQELVFGGSLLPQAMNYVLKKLDIYERVSELKNRHVAFQEDTYLRDPAVTALRRMICNSSTSDYESEDEEVNVCIDTSQRNVGPGLRFANNDNSLSSSNVTNKFYENEFRSQAAITNTPFGNSKQISNGSSQRDTNSAIKPNNSISTFKSSSNNVILPQYSNHNSNNTNQQYQQSLQAPQTDLNKKNNFSSGITIELSDDDDNPVNSKNDERLNPHLNSYSLLESIKQEENGVNRSPNSLNHGDFGDDRNSNTVLNKETDFTKNNNTSHSSDITSKINESLVPTETAIADTPFQDTHLISNCSKEPNCHSLRDKANDLIPTLKDSSNNMSSLKTFGSDLIKKTNSATVLCTIELSDDDDDDVYVNKNNENSYSLLESIKQEQNEENRSPNSFNHGDSEDQSNDKNTQNHNSTNLNEPNNFYSGDTDKEIDSCVIVLDDDEDDDASEASETNVTVERIKVEGASGTVEDNLSVNNQKIEHFAENIVERSDTVLEEQVIENILPSASQDVVFDNEEQSEQVTESSKLQEETVQYLNVKQSIEGCISPHQMEVEAVEEINEMESNQQRANEVLHEDQGNLFSAVTITIESLNLIEVQHETFENNVELETKVSTNLYETICEEKVCCQTQAVKENICEVNTSKDENINSVQENVDSNGSCAVVEEEICSSEIPIDLKSVENVDPAIEHVTEIPPNADFETEITQGNMENNESNDEINTSGLTEITEDAECVADKIINNYVEVETAPHLELSATHITEEVENQQSQEVIEESLLTNDNINLINEEIISGEDASAEVPSVDDTQPLEMDTIKASNRITDSNEVLEVEEAIVGPELVNVSENLESIEKSSNVEEIVETIIERGNMNEVVCEKTSGLCKSIIIETEASNVTEDINLKDNLKVKFFEEEKDENKTENFNREEIVEENTENDVLLPLDNETLVENYNTVIEEPIKDAVDEHESTATVETETVTEDAIEQSISLVESQYNNQVVPVSPSNEGLAQPQTPKVDDQTKALIEIQYSVKVGSGDLELLAEAAANQDILPVKTDVGKEENDTKPRRRKSKVIGMEQTNTTLRKPLGIKRSKKKLFGHEVEIEEGVSGYFKQKSNEFSSTSSHDPKMPYDLFPITNFEKKTIDVQESVDTSEDSNSHSENELTIDEEKQKQNLIFDEETQSDGLEFFNTAPKTPVCISIPEGETSFESFHILNQIENFVDTTLNKPIEQSSSAKPEESAPPANDPEPKVVKTTDYSIDALLKGRNPEPSSMETNKDTLNNEPEQSVDNVIVEPIDMTVERNVSDEVADCADKICKTKAAMKFYDDKRNSKKSKNDVGMRTRSRSKNLKNSKVTEIVYPELISAETNVYFFPKQSNTLKDEFEEAVLSENHESEVIIGTFPINSDLNQSTTESNAIPISQPLNECPEDLSLRTTEVTPTPIPEINISISLETMESQKSTKSRKLSDEKSAMKSKENFKETEKDKVDASKTALEKKSEGQSETDKSKKSDEKSEKHKKSSHLADKIEEIEICMDTKVRAKSDSEDSSGKRSSRSSSLQKDFDHTEKPKHKSDYKKSSSKSGSSEKRSRHYDDYESGRKKRGSSKTENTKSKSLSDTEKHSSYHKSLKSESKGKSEYTKSRSKSPKFDILGREHSLDKNKSVKDKAKDKKEEKDEVISKPKKQKIYDEEAKEFHLESDTSTNKLKIQNNLMKISDSDKKKRSSSHRDVHGRYKDRHQEKDSDFLIHKNKDINISKAEHETVDPKQKEILFVTDHNSKTSGQEEILESLPIEETLTPTDNVTSSLKTLTDIIEPQPLDRTKTKLEEVVDVSQKKKEKEGKAEINQSSEDTSTLISDDASSLKTITDILIRQKPTCSKKRKFEEVIKPHISQKEEILTNKSSEETLIVTSEEPPCLKPVSDTSIKQKFTFSKKRRVEEVINSHISGNEILTSKSNEETLTLNNEDPSCLKNLSDMPIEQKFTFPKKRRFEDSHIIEKEEILTSKLNEEAPILNNEDSSLKILSDAPFSNEEIATQKESEKKQPNEETTISSDFPHSETLSNIKPISPNKSTFEGSVVNHEVIHKENILRSQQNEETSSCFETTSDAQGEKPTSKKRKLVDEKHEHVSPLHKSAKIDEVVPIVSPKEEVFFDNSSSVYIPLPAEPECRTSGVKQDMDLEILPNVGSILLPPLNQAKDEAVEETLSAQPIEVAEIPAVTKDSLIDVMDSAYETINDALMKNVTPQFIATSVDCSTTYTFSSSTGSIFDPDLEMQEVLFPTKLSSPSGYDQVTFDISGGSEMDDTSSTSKKAEDENFVDSTPGGPLLGGNNEDKGVLPGKDCSTNSPEYHAHASPFDTDLSSFHEDPTLYVGYQIEKLKALEKMVVNSGAGSRPMAMSRQDKMEQQSNQNVCLGVGVDYAIQTLNSLSNSQNSDQSTTPIIPDLGSTSTEIQTARVQDPVVSQSENDLYSTQTQTSNKKVIVQQVMQLPPTYTYSHDSKDESAYQEKVTFPDDSKPQPSSNKPKTKFPTFVSCTKQSQPKETNKKKDDEIEMFISRKRGRRLDKPRQISVRTDLINSKGGSSHSYKASSAEEFLPLNETNTRTTPKSANGDKTETHNTNGHLTEGPGPASKPKMDAFDALLLTPNSKTFFELQKNAKLSKVSGKTHESQKTFQSPQLNSNFSNVNHPKSADAFGGHSKNVKSKVPPFTSPRNLQNHLRKSPLIGSKSDPHLKAGSDHQVNVNSENSQAEKKKNDDDFEWIDKLSFLSTPNVFAYRGKNETVQPDGQ